MRARRIAHGRKEDGVTRVQLSGELFEHAGNGTCWLMASVVGDDACCTIGCTNGKAHVALRHARSSNWQLAIGNCKLMGGVHASSLAFVDDCARVAAGRRALVDLPPECLSGLQDAFEGAGSGVKVTSVPAGWASRSSEAWATSALSSSLANYVGPNPHCIPCVCGVKFAADGGKLPSLRFTAAKVQAGLQGTSVRPSTYSTYVLYVRAWGGKVRVPSTRSVFEQSLDASYNSHNSIHAAWILLKLCWKAERKHYQAGTKPIESPLLGPAAWAIIQLHVPLAAWDAWW
eukprot:354542-Chlamydomonas_euryale.AAC.11